VQLLLAHEVLYIAIIALTKLSILFVFIRILPLEIMPKLRIGIPITMGFIVAAWISQEFVFIFQCVPVSYLWNRLRDSRGGYCLNINAWAWANASTNVLMYSCIVCLPLPEVYGMKLHWKKKVRVCLMLMLGSL
jgi:hypothetical protein